MERKSMFQMFKACLSRKRVLDFEGRSPRRVFDAFFLYKILSGWALILPTLFLYAGIPIFSKDLSATNFSVPLLFLLVMLGLFLGFVDMYITLANLSLTVRRIHDFGWSARRKILMPVVITIILILLVLLLSGIIGRELSVALAFLLILCLVWWFIILTGFCLFKNGDAEANKYGEPPIDQELKQEG